MGLVSHPANNNLPSVGALWVTEEIELTFWSTVSCQSLKKDSFRNTFLDSTLVHLCIWSTIPLIFTPQRKFTGNNLASSNHKMINWQLNYNLREGSLLQILCHISYFIYSITSLLKIQRYAVTNYSKGLLPKHNPIALIMIFMKILSKMKTDLDFS